MIRLGVCGAGGRMGQRILSLAGRQSDIFEITAAVDAPGSPRQGVQVGSFTECAGCTVAVTDSLEAVLGNLDAVIDFSTPESSVANAKMCAQAGVPLVIGTTGLSDDQVAQVRSAAESIPLIFAPNMSIGVNLLFKIVGMVASILDEEFDVELVEAHHRFKKDAPSGTAKRLAEIIAQARGVSLETHGNYGRKGLVGERPSGEIGIHTVRMGSVVGDHTVTFANLTERVELTHKAQSRDTFAIGSLTAAKFAVDAQPGLYDMQDVLGLR